MNNFKKYVGENHPDPDSLLSEDPNNKVFDQMCLLVENYAKSKLEEVKSPYQTFLEQYKQEMGNPGHDFHEQPEIHQSLRKRYIFSWVLVNQINKMLKK